MKTNLPGGSALICSDNKKLAYHLKDMLLLEGFEVDIACVASDAKKLIVSNQYRLMILDAMFKDQSAASMIVEMRMNNLINYFPVVMLAATGDDVKGQWGGDAFLVFDWIEKPINFQRLVNSLTAAIKYNSISKPKIIHIEDDLEIISIVSELLGDSVLITPATTLGEAKVLLATENFDMVILDLNLPDGGGEEIIPLLRGKVIQSLPVIIFSAEHFHVDSTKRVVDSLLMTKVDPKSFNEILHNNIRRVRLLNK